MIQHDQPEIVLEEVACPVCTSSRHRRHLKTTDPLHGVGGVFQIVRCEDCRHIFMNPVPTVDSLAACYPAAYGPHASQTSDTSLPSREESPGNSESEPSRKTEAPWYLSSGFRRIPGLRFLYYWLSDTRSNYLPTPPEKDARAIELGCATGGFLAKLANAGWQADGVELVDTAATVAQQQGFPVHVGTLQSAELSADTYDAAFAWMVIEHLIDPRSAFDEFHRILKHNGQIAFSVPNVSCWEPLVFRRSWYVWEVPRHLQYFGPRSLRKLLAESGFDDVQIVQQRNILNVIGSLGIALRRLRPKSRLAERLIDCPNRLSMWWKLLLAPAAIFLAMIRQGGRLTVIARCNKPTANPLTQNEEQPSESA
ncbi:MAG: SAM-dependent methyltransferase [Porticoccaceae bacterium]|jgi:SAM-dependent methyltransferase